jgi:hypothetical protein
MNQQKRRLATYLTVQLVVLFLIVGAFILRYVIDHAPGNENGRISTCIMHNLLHIYCPFCGGTRAMVALVKGQIWNSLCYNPLSAYLTAGFLYFDVVAAVRIKRNHPTPLSIPKWYWIVGIVIAVLVFLVRNVALIGFGLDNLGDLVGYWSK